MTGQTMQLLWVLSAETDLKAAPLAYRARQFIRCLQSSKGTAKGKSTLYSWWVSILQHNKIY